MFLGVKKKKVFQRWKLFLEIQLNFKKYCKEVQIQQNFSILPSDWGVDIVTIRNFISDHMAE